MLVFGGVGLLLQDARIPSGAVWCYVASSPEDDGAQKVYL